VDLDLGLEFTDALLRCGEFGALGRRQPGLEATVDAVLATPQVDRLFTDPEIARHIGDLASRLDKIKNATTELRRIAPSSHGCLLSGQQHRIQLSDSTEPGADQVCIKPGAVQPGAVALHSGVPDNAGSGGEFHVGGYGRLVDEITTRTEASAAASYSPEARYNLFELLLSEARVNGYSDVALLINPRWTAARE